DGYMSKANLDSRIVGRIYQGRGMSVVSCQTVGVLGVYAHNCSSVKGLTFSGNSWSNGWTAGAFGELGGAYLITHSFSIGGTATVAFSYERTTQRSSSGAVAKGWAYSGSIQGLSFAATVYF